MDTKTRYLILPAHAYRGVAEDGHELVNLRSLGILPVPAGGAYGTNTEGDVLTQTADGRPLNDVWAEFQAALRAFNQSRDELISLLTFPVQEPIESVPTISQEGEFEEASEFGEPKGIRIGAFREFAYDFKWFDLAIRYTWKFLAEASQAQLDTLNENALNADNRLVFNRVLKAIFNNTNRTADVGVRTGLNVYPLYNADGEVPPPYKNTTFAGTHNHYLVSGAATVDSGDLDDLADTITEHGYGAGAGGQLVLLVNKAQLVTIRNFRVDTGASYDFIPAANQPPFLLPTNTGGVANPTPPTTFLGRQVQGQYGPWFIIEDGYIPAGYMLGFATGGAGAGAAQNLVGIREHRNAGLRGLQLVKGPSPDYPLVDSFYRRGFGTGVRQRGAGAVMQIKATGTYDIPAAYA